MIPAPVLLGGLAVLGAVVLGLGGFVFGWRAVRQWHTRRTQRLLAPFRSQILALAAGEDEGPGERSTPGAGALSFTGLAPATWAAVEELVLSLVEKVSGSARDALVSVLAEHYTATRAVAGTHSKRGSRRSKSAAILGLLGGPRALEALVPLLGDRRQDVRLAASHALGTLGSHDALEGDRVAKALLCTIDTKAGLPPAAAADALFRLGSSAQGALLEALKSSDALRAITATQVVGRAGVLGAARPLLSILSEAVAREGEARDIGEKAGNAEDGGRTRPDERLLVAAAHALGRIGLPAATGPLLASTGAQHPTALRIAAVQALGDLQDQRAAGALAALLKASTGAVADAAARALAGLGPPGIEHLEEAIQDT